MRDVIEKIRDKVHAHNRGGELNAGLRDEIRNICDQALASVDMVATEEKKAMGALGVTIVSPGNVHVDFRKFLTAVGQEKCKGLLALIAEIYDMGTVVTKKEDGGLAAVLPAAHRAQT